MVFMVLEILDAQSVGEIVVTKADVHPPPDLDLEVKLEQQEEGEEGGDDDIEEVQMESAASALLLLSQSKKEPFDLSNSAPHCGKVKINTHFISHALSVMDLFCK